MLSSCCCRSYCCSFLLLVFFFFNDTATTEIYTLSLHDALPISRCRGTDLQIVQVDERVAPDGHPRSEEHTSELQSHSDLVCRLLLEKKKNKKKDAAVIARTCEHLDDLAEYLQRDLNEQMSVRKP